MGPFSGGGGTREKKKNKAKIEGVFQGWNPAPKKPRSTQNRLLPDWGELKRGPTCCSLGSQGNQKKQKLVQEGVCDGAPGEPRKMKNIGCREKKGGKLDSTSYGKDQF